MAQEGGLASAVAPGKAQLPVGVDLNAQVLEYVVIAAVIGKGHMRNLNQRHCYVLLLHRKMAAGKLPQPE